MKKQAFIVCRHLLRFPLVKDAHEYLKRHDAQQLHFALNSEGGADIFSIVGRCQWEQNALALLTKLSADNPTNHFHLFTECGGLNHENRARLDSLPPNKKPFSL